MFLPDPPPPAPAAARGDRVALLESTKDAAARRNSSDFSLMEKVRLKMAATAQAFSVPGVQSGGAIMIRTDSDMRPKLKPRKTCGREISVTFRNLVLVCFTTILLLTMIALLVTQIVLSRDISNSLINSCTETTEALLDEAAEFIFTTLTTVVIDRLEDSTVDFTTYIFNQAQAQVGSLSNFLVGVGFASNALQNLNQSAVFIRRQTAAEYFSWVDVTAIGIAGSNSYRDSNYCHRLFDGDLSPEAVGSCNFTTGITSGTTLQRCSVLQPLESVLQCTDYSDFIVANQTPYRMQADFGLVDPNNSTSMFMWTPPYQIQGVEVEVYGRKQGVIGFGLSYPVFTDSCQQYGCLDTAIWSVITSRAIAGFCAIEATVSQNSSTEFSSFHNDSTIYVVDGGRSPSTSGTLLGAIYGVGRDPTLIVPDTLRAAVESNVSVIANSSQVLLREYGSFANPEFDSVSIQAYFTNTLEPCNVTVSREDRYPYAFQNCSLVAAISVTAPHSATIFPTLVPARYVIVYSVALSNLLAPLVDQFVIAQQQADAQREQQDDSIRALVGVGVGIAVGAIIAGIIAAWLLAVRITVPIQKLDKSMRNVMNFKFKTNQAEYYSRVSDIGHAEQTMESLSHAVEVFSKFVPETVVRGIVQGKPERSRLHVEPRVVTVAFSDIKGFTTISEKLEISDLLLFLTRYLTIMTEVVKLYEGTVTEILGDGLLVLWNAPDDCSMHAAKACAAALAMQVAVEHVAAEFLSILASHGLENLAIRVGIHTGRVLAGNIGSTTKLKYGCLGDTVNTASRLEGLCKLYGVGVICSEDTLAMLPPGKFKCRELDNVQVKGKDEPLKLFEVRGLREVIVLEPVDSISSQPGPESSEQLAKQHMSSGSNRDSLRSLRKFSAMARTAIRLPRRDNLTSNDELKTLIKSFGPIESGTDVGGSSHTSFDANVEHYEAALHLFQSGEFSEAIAILETLGDTASKVLLSRARAAETSLKDGELDLTSWTGINRLTEKF